jgi:hypothetical protein
MEDEVLSRLIAGRNAPSVLAKEQLFERIYAQVQAKPERRAWGALFGAFAGAAAVAAVALLLVRSGQPEFQARGSHVAAAGGPELVVSCPGASGCRVGSKLSFAVRFAEPATTANAGYFAAFARRFDGTIIWYFPEPVGSSIAVPQTSEPELLDRAVLLGTEHVPGHYEVYGVFSRQALTREQLKLKVGEDLSGSPGVVVVRRPLEVLP